MDLRLQKIIEETKMKFGLDNYILERTSIYKKRDPIGKIQYTFNMEWFPAHEEQPVDEDSNPDGTAVVEYNISVSSFASVVFVGGISNSTITHFNEKTSQEVGKWIESETGLIYGVDFKLSGSNENEYTYESDIDGIKLTPSGVMNVEFDTNGKLINFNIHGTIPSQEEIIESIFTLTLENIEPLVKKQLQLVKIPSESKKCFVPVYAMEEVFISMDGSKLVPYLEHERSEIILDEIIVWEAPLVRELNRQDIFLASEITVDEAFKKISDEAKLFLSNEDIELSTQVVRDVLRTEFPLESGKWKVATIERKENYIEAVCRMNEEDDILFNRKFVVFIEPQTFGLLNYIDNGAMFEIFDSFEPAKTAVITHDDAYEKMLPYITLEPTYVYDLEKEKYILYGLLDAAEGVDALTGEIVFLQDI
ncbi:hypothetical protein ACFSFY_03050 [Sporosarcina siberiensis]|uniref:Uncharacterized protein n=1 Tax=Sporosarcina siberiensis TaxID=1365606 RepID=A0ABW4SC39_9BACL